MVSWREVLKALSKKGFRVIRQSGSHIVLASADGNRRKLLERLLGGSKDFVKLHNSD